MTMRLSAPSYIFPIAIILAACCGCHPIEEFDNDPEGNFETLWRTVDEHYCFFSEKEIDWNTIHDRYRPLINDGMTSRELFLVCADMLEELRDGHTNLSSGFATSYYRKWWSDYPQNFDARLIQQYYFNFHYTQIGAWMYGILPQNVGYIRIPTFSSGLGHGNIDAVLSDLRTCLGLIIDVRDNGGGNLSNVQTLVEHFITNTVDVGYMTHKTGPGHGDFSEAYPINYEPAGANHVTWQKPVVILTNRSTFSAANHFVAVMSGLSGVTIAGATTGGGSGMPYSSELPCGWSVRMSAVSMLDADGNPTESGISPDQGCAVDLDPVDALNGVDTMLEFAIRKIIDELEN